MGYQLVVLNMISDPVMPEKLSDLIIDVFLADDRTDSLQLYQLWPWLLVELTGYFYGIKTFYKWGFLSTYNLYFGPEL